jgi:hypothetical protein
MPNAGSRWPRRRRFCRPSRLERDRADPTERGCRCLGLAPTAQRCRLDWRPRPRLPATTRHICRQARRPRTQCRGRRYRPPASTPRSCFVLQRLDAAAGKAECAPRRLQHGLADTGFQVIDVTIDDDARLLAEGQLGPVAEGELEPCCGTGAKLVPEMHRDADARCDGIAARDDLRLMLHFVDYPGAFGGHWRECHEGCPRRRRGAGNRPRHRGKTKPGEEQLHRC